MNGLSIDGSTSIPMPRACVVRAPTFFNLYCTPPTPRQPIVFSRAPGLQQAICGRCRYAHRPGISKNAPRFLPHPRDVGSGWPKAGRGEGSGKGALGTAPYPQTAAA